MKTEVVEDDPNVEYLEDRDAVRYVAYWSSGGGDTPVKTDEHGRRAIYETVPFDRWAEKELLHAAAKAAAAHVNEVLDTDEVGYGVGTGGGDQEGSIAYVVVSTVLNRQGEVAVGSDGERLTTDVEFDDLVAATPATVSVVYRFEENEVEQEVPVYATHDVIQHS